MYRGAKRTSSRPPHEPRREIPPRNLSNGFQCKLQAIRGIYRTGYRTRCRDIERDTDSPRDPSCCVAPAKVCICADCRPPAGPPCPPARPPCPPARPPCPTAFCCRHECCPSSGGQGGRECCLLFSRAGPSTEGPSTAGPSTLERCCGTVPVPWTSSSTQDSFSVAHDNAHTRLPVIQIRLMITQANSNGGTLMMAAMARGAWRMAQSHS